MGAEASTGSVSRTQGEEIESRRIRPAGPGAAGQLSIVSRARTDAMYGLVTWRTPWVSADVWPW